MPIEEAARPAHPPDSDRALRQTAASTPSIPGAPTEGGIFLILSQFAAMQLVLASTGLVRNKVVALKLGPAAFGELSQLGSAAAVIAAVVSFGMSMGLTRNGAKAASVDERQAQLASANGIVLGLGSVVILAMLALLFSGRLLPLVALAQRPATVFATVVFLAAVPVEALSTNYFALLRSVLDVRGLATRRGGAVLLATVVAVPIVWTLGFAGAAIQSFLLTLFVSILLGWRCRQLGYSPLSVALRWPVAARLASFGMVSMVSGFTQVFADTAVRAALIGRAGAAANGVLQAPYALSAMLRGVVLASIGSVALATIASKTDRAEISAAVDRLLNVVLPVGASALGLLGLLGAPALALLYSKAFASGARLFPFILCADLLVVFVWIVGAPVLAQGDRLLWLVLELVQAAARWSIALLLIPRWGALAVAAGYLAAAALQAALNLTVFWGRYRLHLAGKHIRRLGIGLTVVAALAGVGPRAAGSPPVLVAALATWFAFTLYYGRRSGALAALQQRLRRG
jgi:O-antigen/teichoic acid export membrane protein